MLDDVLGNLCMTLSRGAAFAELVSFAAGSGGAGAAGLELLGMVAGQGASEAAGGGGGGGVWAGFKPACDDQSASRFLAMRTAGPGRYCSPLSHVTGCH